MNPFKLSSITFKSIITNQNSPNLFESFSTNQVFEFLYSVIEDEYDTVYFRFGFFSKYAKYGYHCHQVPISEAEELEIEELCFKNFWNFVGKFQHGMSKAKLCFVRELNYDEAKLEYSKCIRINTLNNELLRFVYIKINSHLTRNDKCVLTNVYHIVDAKKTRHLFIHPEYWNRLDFNACYCKILKDEKCIEQKE